MSKTNPSRMGLVFSKAATEGASDTQRTIKGDNMIDNRGTNMPIRDLETP